MHRFANWRYRVFLAAAVLAAGGGTVVSLMPKTASAVSCGLPAPSTKTHASSWNKAVSGWVGNRSGQTTAAAYDYVAGKWYFFNNGAHRFDASIAKADILETLLHRSRGALNSYQKSLATRMIEYSDNTAADALWIQINKGAGLTAYNQKAGLTHTVTDSLAGESMYWGLTRTEAVDQVQLLRRLAQPNSLLSDSSRSYQLYLMRHVTACQRWGVPYGVPSTASVAVKNGWLDVHDWYHNWEINTIGYVHGNGKRYLVAILSQHNPDMYYGVTTVDRVAALTWHFMKTFQKPAPKPTPSPTPTPTKSPSPTPSPTVSPTATPSPSQTATPTVSPSDTASPSVSPTDSASPSSGPTDTASPTPT